jgi:YVTN family beta-propeller protein
MSQPKILQGERQKRRHRKMNPRIKSIIFPVFIAFALISMRSESLAEPFAHITNYGDNTVSLIDISTNSVIDTISVGSGPTAVGVNPLGTRVYVTNRLENTVSVTDTATNNVIAIIPVEDQPRGIAVSPTGTRIYVTNRVGNSVSVIDSATNTVIDTVLVGNGPLGVAVDPMGTRVSRHRLSNRNQNQYSGRHHNGRK